MTGALAGCHDFRRVIAEGSHWLDVFGDVYWRPVRAVPEKVSITPGGFGKSIVRMAMGLRAFGHCSRPPRQPHLCEVLRPKALAGKTFSPNAGESRRLSRIVEQGGPPVCQRGLLWAISQTSPLATL